MTPTLQIKPKALMKEFVEEYSEMFDIDKDLAYHYIKTNERFDYLTEKWYEYLEQDDIQKAYSVYDDEYYFTDMWNCFKIYSRQYLRDMYRKSKTTDKAINDYIQNVNTVVDTGCGVGFTTSILKEMFPNASVYGTNLKNTKQWMFCERKALKHNFNLIEDISQVPEKEVDLFFSSEYFEHIHNPIEHVKHLVEVKNPKYFIIANAFNTNSIGHFVTYKHGNEFIDQSVINRMFNKQLRHMGYVKIKTGLFNDRPNFWVRNDMLENKE